MKNRPNILFTILAFLIILSNPALGWSQSASGKIVMEFDLSAHDATQAANLWIPYPISNQDQNITQVKVKGNFSQSAVYTDRKFQTPMLYARWEKNSNSRLMNVSFHVDRQEITQPDFPAKEGAWNPADFAIYLKGTRLGPIDGKVKQLADKITANQKGVLEKAKAIYDWTCENTYRDPQTRGCGFGDVYQLLKNPGGKCADISSIFVALLRAAGVPSRETFGIRMGKNAVTDISQWQHCWAQFYLPGYGWITADPADVRKMMLKEKLTLADKKTRDLRDYFWGGVDAYRLELAHGRDLVLNPAQNGEPVNYLMYPFAQIGPKTLDWLDPNTFKYKITYYPN